MKLNLTFYGAAQNVTGSQYLLENSGSKSGGRILVDCGMYQERQYRSRNWDPLPYEPASIDAVLLTHAHLDHCGLLPKLVREGFEGKIYCTAATKEIARIILLDAAHIQEEDAAFKKARHEREGREAPHPEVPLYTTEDARAVLPRLEPIKYGQTVKINDAMEATFNNAGHIFGAASISVRASDNGESRTVLFSGDLGRWDMPIIRDPADIEQADYVVVESTYGDRIHNDADNIDEKLADVINSTKEAGGNIVIPSFALERSQDLLYHLNQLLIDDDIPHLVVFLDSPMAINVTDVFDNHPELYDSEMRELVRRNKSPFDFPGLRMTQTTRESKAINHIRGTVIIIAGSGMCTGGRIKHHLVNNITRPESTVLFVGYQAAGTLGRHIVEGADEVRILGQNYPVRAKIVKLDGFSAHADRDDLMRWLGQLDSPPRQVFVTHGEPDSARALAEGVKKNFNYNVTIPEYRDSITLD